MLISERLYPHPVLSWFSDDYPERVFQPAIEVKPNATFFRIIMSCNTSSKAIKDLISKKQAAYCIHVECSSTRYRGAFTSYDQSFEVDIPVSDLEGKVEVSRFVVCTAPVQNFSSSEFHDDFSGRSFDLMVGDTIAVAETVDFPALKKDDELAKLPSIFSIVPNLNDTPPPLDTSLLGNKIVVSLSPELHARFLNLNSSMEARALLCSMILIPALVNTLSEIRTADNKYELNDRRWFRVLSKRFSDLGVDIMRLDQNPETNVVLASRLLDDPITRAFEDLEEALSNFGGDEDE